MVFVDLFGRRRPTTSESAYGVLALRGWKAAVADRDRLFKKLANRF